MFIALTERNGQSVFVNVSLICWIRRSTDPRGGSMLVFSAGSDNLRDSMLEVVELPEMVCRRINIASDLQHREPATAPHTEVYRAADFHRGEEA